MSRYTFPVGNTFASKGKGMKHPPDCAHCAAVRTGNKFDRKAWERVNHSREDVKRKRAERHKRWREHNREILNAKKAADYLANREQRKLMAAEWRRANPKNISTYRTKRRMKLGQGAIGDRAAIRRWVCDWRSRQTVECYWCGETRTPSECHSDHVIALSLGGSHDVGNLVIACASCNIRKRDKPIDVWMSEIRKAS